MKKLLFILVLSFLSVNLANSQVLISILLGDKLNSDKLEFGLTVGPTWATLSGIEDAKYLRSLSLGLYFNIKLGEHWFLHPAAEPKFTYGATNLSVYPTGEPDIDDIFKDNSTVERRISAIPVPVLIRYQTKSAWGIEVGPQFTLRTKAKDVFRKPIEEAGNLELTIDNKDLYKRITFEAAFGVYKKLMKGEGVTLNLRYVLGLSDILKENTGPAQKHGAIQFIVGIPIGKGKAKDKAVEEEIKEVEEDSNQ